MTTPIVRHIVDKGSTRYQTVCCDHITEPLAVMLGLVNTESGTTVYSDNPSLRLSYTPTGFTDVLWDTGADIGTICRECGRLFVLPDLLRRFLGPLEEGSRP